PGDAGCGNVLDRLEPLGERVRAEAALAQPCEHLGLRRELDALPVTSAVDPGGQRAVSRDRRVLLSQRAGGGIARVGRELLIRAGEAFVELTEAGKGEVDLAAHLDDYRRVVTLHAERDRLDRAQVRRHVLALDAVAARRTTYEDAVLVRQVDREPVDLGLD